MSPSRHRSFCFTLNNYDHADDFGARLIARTAKYAIIGKEIGESGTPHLQGYVSLPNPVSFDKIKKSIPRAHIEVAKGSDTDNQIYCKKSGDYQEWGTPSIGQGNRSDIKNLAQQIRNHELTLEDIMFDYPELYFKYSRAIERMIVAAYPHRTTPPHVEWIWGDAGVGKTRYCVEKHPDSWYPKDNTPWWDNYEQQEAIIIDDYDSKDSIPYRTFLRILDRYSYQGQVKGGYVKINSPFIYITSEFPPDHFWEGNTLAQVLRRLASVRHIK